MNMQIENKRDKYEEKQYHGGMLKQGSCEQAKQQQVQPPTTLYSPSSSPSHEFSFTVSLNPSSNNTITAPADKTKPTTPSSHALDLSPADDIFFHGHLLPLHLLSHLPVSPRNSLDSFTLPIKDLFQDPTSNIINNNTTKNSDTTTRDNEICDDHEYNKCNGNDLKEEPQIKIRPKAKSFSLFGRSKGRKENENGDKERQKKKLKFEVSHMLKRYMKMVKPILSLKNNNRRENGEIHKQSHSFSGNVSLRHDDGFETRFSAPASMWTSPSNSGVLVGKRNVSSPPSSDSTMEELQAAIQAAIAHCKSSIAVEDKIKCHD